MDFLKPMGNHQDGPQHPDTAIPYVIHDYAVLTTLYNHNAADNDGTMVVSKSRYGSVGVFSFDGHAGQVKH
jgi:hypothetical protein